MDPNIGKATIGKERTVAACKESPPTSRGPHRNRFLEVQAEIRARMASDKKTLLAEANASAKRMGAFCRRDMDGEGVKKDIWSVMEDFSKAPEGKDLSKMKAQYEMFVDTVGSKQVTV